jgi:hypothetical protein
MIALLSEVHSRGTAGINSSALGRSVGRRGASQRHLVRKGASHGVMPRSGGDVGTLQ